MITVQRVALLIASPMFATAVGYCALLGALLVAMSGHHIP